MTRAWAQGDPDLLRERISAVLRVTALVCVPAGLGLSAVAEPLIRLLYGDAPSSALVAEVLALLGPAAIFAAMSTPLSSLLQAVGRPDLPVKLILAAMALKLLANRFLCGLETVHVFGAALGTLFCYCFLTLGELILLTRVTKIRLPWRQLFWPPVCCGGICAVGAFFAWKKLENCISFSRLGTLVGLGAAVLFGGILYFFGLWMFGQKTKSQNNRTKPGQKIAKTLEKRG